MATRGWQQWASPRDLSISVHFSLSLTILTHTSNAKCFRNVALINIRDLAEFIVLVRGYGRHSPNQVLIKRELLTLLKFYFHFRKYVLFFGKKALQWTNQYMYYIKASF